MSNENENNRNNKKFGKTLINKLKEFDEKKEGNKPPLAEKAESFLNNFEKTKDEYSNLAISNIEKIKADREEKRKRRELISKKLNSIRMCLYGGYFAFTGYLFYAGLVKKKFKISAKFVVYLPLSLFFMGEMASQNYLNNNY